jgi:hypothetical protein
LSAEASFLASVGGALGMAVLAAVAAFLMSLPDRSRYWVLLPVPALALWISTIGYGCLTNWVHMAPDGMRLGETARCFATLVLTGVPLSLLMLVMLRHVAQWRPTASACMGALATGGFAAGALSLLHDLDASLMVLVWNIGTVVLFISLAGTAGPRMLRWIALR